MEEVKEEIYKLRENYMSETARIISEAIASGIITEEQAVELRGYV